MLMLELSYCENDLGHKSQSAKLAKTEVSNQPDNKSRAQRNLDLNKHDFNSASAWLPSFSSEQEKIRSLLHFYSLNSMNAKAIMVRIEFNKPDKYLGQRRRRRDDIVKLGWWKICDQILRREDIADTEWIYCTDLIAGRSRPTHTSSRNEMLMANVSRGTSSWDYHAREPTNKL